MSLTNSMASIEEIVKFQQELLNHQRSQKLIQKETIKLLNALNKNITFMSDRLDQFALRTNIKLNNTDQSQHKQQQQQQQSSSSKAKSSSSYDDVFNSVINTCNSFFNDNKSSSSFLNKSTTTTTSRHHSTRQHNNNNSNSKTSKTTLKLSDVSSFFYFQFSIDMDPNV